MTVRDHGATAAAELPPILRQAQRPGVLVVVAVVAIAAITGAGFWLKGGDDAGALVVLNQWHTGAVGAFTSFAYNALEPVPSVLIAVVVTGLLWWRRHDLRVALAFAGTVAATWIPSDMLKFVVGRPRPDHAVLPHPFSPVQTDPSFPSGHTVFVFALSVALALTLWDTAWRYAVVTLGLLVSVVLGVSVLVDGIHYPTDVLASIAWVATTLPAVRWLWADVILRRVPLPFARPALGV